MLKTAIVGTGGIARAHAAAIAEHADRLELVAIMDVDPERLADFQEAHGVPHTYTDLNQLLEREHPDVVQICSPPFLHADQCIASLESGAWVLCEKPLTGSLHDLDRIAAAEQRTGRYVSSVAQWRFGSRGQHVRQLINTNAMGRPLVGVCNTLWFRPPEYYAVPWRGKWETEVGGASMALGIHIVDLLLYLLGDWTELYATMATIDREIEDENVAMAIVQFSGGAHVSITNSAVSPRQESYLRLDFPKATVELTTLYGYSNASWRFSPPPDGALPPEWSHLPPEQPTSQGA